ncbi:ATP-binding cassette domain-containing protein, partial [Bordetella pertussis]|uniref:ATP-binding cassette domain-containing protein n=1 Tax=Bordetella pertussis TaxID=520 RepID=UPI000B0D9040
MTHPILEVARVTMRFGGIVALNDVSLQVRQGDIHAVIGPNGAGKSTLLNVITGIYRPTSGAVRLQGGQLDRLPPHRICRLGVCPRATRAANAPCARRPWSCWSWSGWRRTAT